MERKAMEILIIAFLFYTAWLSVRQFYLYLHAGLRRAHCSFGKGLSSKLVWTILSSWTGFFCNHICRNVLICE